MRGGATHPVLRSWFAAARRSRRLLGQHHLHGSDFVWAVAFVVPYVAVLFAFAVYPVCCALWMAGRPSLYAELLADPRYLPTLVNTLIFVGLGVNVKMFLALLLSGFFARRSWWIKILLVVYVLPWMLAAVQAFISIHWMLIGELGLVDRVLSELFGIKRPDLVQRPPARARLRHHCLYLEMDAVLDRDLSCGQIGDPAAHLRCGRS